MKRFLSVLLCAALVLVLLPAITLTAAAESLTQFNIQLDAPVASYTPDFYPVFNMTSTVYFNVTWKENSPGFNMTLNSSDEFKAGLAYKVEIWIKLGDGDYLATNANGDLDAALTVNGNAISSLKINGRNDQGKINQVTITCEYDPLPGMVISSALVKGIPTPVAGNMPIYSFTLGNSNAYNFYHTEPVVWWDLTAERQMDSGDTFIKGHKYQLNIWLRANREGGFTFKTDNSDNPQVNVTLNSWAPDSVTKAYEQEGREVIDIRYTFPACQAAHTCTPQLVKQQDPTCLLSGFKAYYACSCGKCYEDAAGKKLITDMDGYGIIPANGHKEGTWSYNGTHHYKKCTTCKEVIPGTNAAHAGGTATCAQKGKCTVCGTSYGSISTEHKWSPTYLYKDAKGHAWVCADCKTHDTVKPHNPGAEATETTPQTCKDCGYIIEPALNHIHQLALLPDVAPTCTASGTVQHYACSGCTACFSDPEGKKPIPEDTELFPPPLGHSVSDTWRWDVDFHWRTCTNCQEILEETKMAHDAQNGNCAACGYEIGAPSTEPATPTDNPVPTVTDPAQNSSGTDNADENSWLGILLIAFVCFAAAVTATVIIMKKKKN